MKTTYSVPVPRKPTELIDLGIALVEQNSKQKPQILSQSDIALLSEKCKDIIAKRKLAKELLDESVRLSRAADSILGIDKAQNARSENTVLFLVTKMKTILLGNYRNDETMLRQYGFKVSRTNVSISKEEDSTPKTPVKE